jgi:hypothetical protein
MGPIGCSETSVRNYHHTLRNSLEGEREIVFGCVLLTESNVMHFIVPKFLLRSVAFKLTSVLHSKFYKHFPPVYIASESEGQLGVRKTYLEPCFFASLGYTAAKNCRGTYGIRVKCDVRLACCDVILSRAVMSYCLVTM